MRRLSCFVVLALVAGGTSDAFAQRTAATRGFVSVNVGSQPSATTFAEPIEETFYLESARIEPTYRIPSGLLFDVGGGVRIASIVGAGLSVSSFSQHDEARITGAIPHPFFYNTPRTIEGADSGRRQETTTHVQALVFVPTHSRVDLVLSAGPSFFSVKQDIVNGISFDETYPYDSATFGAATKTRVSKTGFGFNVGADVGVRFSKYVGVGGLIRYAHASLDFSVPNATGNVTSDVGGLQGGGGLRLFF